MSKVSLQFYGKLRYSEIPATITAEMKIDNMGYYYADYTVQAVRDGKTQMFRDSALSDSDQRKLSTFMNRVVDCCRLLNEQQ